MQSNTINKSTKFFSLIKEALSGEGKDYTTGSINRALFMLAVPMVLEMIMESLFAVVDVLYVGRIGENAVATVGLTESVITIIYAIGIGLAMTATAFVARRTGEKKMKEASFAAGQAIALALVISLPLSIAGIIFGDDILRLMGASAAVIEEGSTYARIALGSNIIIMMLFLNNAVFRGAGDASIAMRVLILSNILNIILAPIFIFGLGPIPAMGVTGAAVATTIGRGTGVIFQLYVLFSGRSLVRVTLADLKIRASMLLEMLRMSLGGIGQFLINSASWIFLVRIISMFGSDAMAGYTFAIRIIIFTILPSWGLANAAATLVGQNLGAGQPERAEQSVWKAAFFNMIFLASVAVLFFICAPFILSLFSKNPVVIGYGVSCLRIICLGYISFAYGMVMSQAFNGAGDTRTPTIMNFFCFWVVQIPLAYLLGVIFDMGIPGICTAVAIADTLLAVIGIILFRKGKWKQVKV
jgi:putative MATE family efflux protein